MTAKVLRGKRVAEGQQKGESLSSYVFCRKEIVTSPLRRGTKTEFDAAVQTTSQSEQGLSFKAAVLGSNKLCIINSYIVRPLFSVMNELTTLM